MRWNIPAKVQLLFSVVFITIAFVFPKANGIRQTEQPESVVHAYVEAAAKGNLELVRTQVTNVPSSYWRGTGERRVVGSDGLDNLEPNHGLPETTGQLIPGDPGDGIWRHLVEHDFPVMVRAQGLHVSRIIASSIRGEIAVISTQLGLNSGGYDPITWEFQLVKENGTWKIFMVSPR